MKARKLSLLAICIVLEYGGIILFSLEGETLRAVTWAVLVVLLYVAGINFIGDGR